MQDSVIEFVTMCANLLPIAEPVYEIGSLQVPGQEGYADLRPIFAGHRYVGVDMRPGPGVDVVLDMTAKLLPEKAGTIICVDTLEHVAEPFKLAQNAMKSLKYAGLIIIAAPFRFPVHDYPSDYWRFTSAGIAKLFNGYEYYCAMTRDEKESFGVISSSPCITKEFAKELDALCHKYRTPSLAQRILRRLSCRT